MTYQEYNDLQALYEKEGQTVSWSIANVLRGTGYINRTTLIVTAYILLMATDTAISLDSIETFCSSVNASEDRKAFIESCLDDTWQMVAGQRNRYNGNILKSIILFSEDRDLRINGENKTPSSISRLAYKLFALSDNDAITDFCFGSGAFITEAYLCNPSLKISGIEINASNKEITAIQLEIMGCDPKLEHGNIFDLDPDTHKYDHIFSNYPFGLRLREIGFDRYKLLQKIAQNSDAFSKSISSDWFFNASIIECLKENGRAVAIMTNGSTWNTLDKPARKYFIENGYIEAIIALPEKMSESINMPTTMIILSRNNKRTMLVDATELCEKGRRFNTFTDDQIEQIADAAKRETAYSKYVTQEELAYNDYVINPIRYLTEDIVVENGVPFSTIIKSITRGAPIKASELDEMVSEEPTDYQYLMLANIQHGQIDSELPYIKSIQDNQKKYCLKNHSLILSKNGAPFKVAVAEIQPGKSILANGNLFIIEIDEEKADPYFIKAFLESEKGIAILKSITVGATIPNIGVESLKKIKVPQLPLEQQREVAARYLAKIDEIALYKRKLQKAYEELRHIYDNKE